jgi:hypothetical protein
MLRMLKPVLLGAAALLATVQAAPSPALAKDWDLTGTLDCGIHSNVKCHFKDWATGPTFGVFSEDIGAARQRVTVDASWVRDDLQEFGQDDFVWFVVRDLGNQKLQILSVVEHRCVDGTLNPGRSTANTCYRENGEPVDDDD